MRVSFLIPWGKDLPERLPNLLRLMTEVRSVCAKNHWDYAVGAYPHEPFSRARAINAAARKVPNSDVYIIQDADVLLHPDGYGLAVKAAVASAQLVQPFTRCLHLTAEASDLVRLQGSSPWDFPLYPEYFSDLHSTYVYPGGIQVVARELWEACNGYDPRLVGWGKDDECFLETAHRLAGGSRSLSATSFHMHHPSGLISNQLVGRNDDYLAEIQSVPTHRLAQYLAARPSWRDTDYAGPHADDPQVVSA